MALYFDLAWLRAQLDTLGANGLVAALEPPSDSVPDPARLALYQAVLLASYRLQTDPAALDHQLYGRLHAHAHLPDIAALRAQITLSLHPLQEPWLSQAGGALISLSSEQRERPSEKRETLPISGPKPDSKWIRLQDGRILTWNWKEPPYLWSSEGVFLGEWPTDGQIALDVQQSHDGRYVVTGLGDEALVFWSPQGEPIRTITYYNHLCSVKELMDGRWLIYGSNVQPQVWSADLEDLIILEGHKGILISVRELTDGRLVSMAEALRVWSSDGTLLTTISLPDKDGRWLTLEPGNLLRAWVPFYRITEFWDPSRPDLSPQKHHDGLIAGIVPLPDGGALTWSYGGTHDPIRWGSDGTPAATLTGHTEFISGAVLMPDGRILSHSWDTTLRLWSSDGAPLAVLSGHTSRIEAAVLSDGRILSWSWDKTLRLWSSDGEPLAVMIGHTDSVRDACQLMDGRILSGSYDRTLRLWSADGAPLMIINESHDRSSKVLELRNGRWLSWSQDAHLWSSTGELLAAMDGHMTWLRGACELSDGRLLTWSFYTQVRLWLWSPDGERLAAIDLPWDIHPVVIRAWFTQHAADWMTFVRHVYPTDGQVMVWFEQHRLDVCDAASGESLTTIYTDSPITAAAINGQTVIVGCKNGQVAFFRWTGTA